MSRATKFRLVSRCPEILEILEDLERLFESDDACIARTMSGWASVSFAPALLATYRSVRGVLVGTPKGIPKEGKLFQAAVGRSLAASTEFAHDGMIDLMIRMRRWMGEVPDEAAGHVSKAVKFVILKSGPYLGLTFLRVLSRGLNTSARFHSQSHGCLFGCCTDTFDPSLNDLDDIAHYSRCSRFYWICEHWLGELMPPFSESPPWLFSLLPTTERLRTVLLLTAAVFDAFMFAHNCRRHQLSSGNVSQQIHARTGATARRRRSIAGAWKLERRLRLLFETPA